MQRDAFHRWPFLGNRDDGKEYAGRGNAYGFGFAIQPRSQPLGMLGAGAGTTGHIVCDGAAGLAEPRLIERDHTTLSGPIDDLMRMRHRCIPTDRNITSGENPQKQKLRKLPARFLRNGCAGVRPVPDPVGKPSRGRTSAGSGVAVFETENAESICSRGIRGI